MSNESKSRRHSVATLLAGQTIAGDTERLPWQMPGTYGPLPVATSPLRGTVNALGVHTDGAAVAVWLADCADNSVNTAQSYRKEAERLLLWESECKGLALCQLGRADFLEFTQFLRNVPADWIMDRRYKRNDPRWRPFLQQPSESSISFTITVLHGMMRYLVDAGWLVANPMPKPRSQAVRVWRPSERALPKELVALALEVTEPNPDHSPKERIIHARDRWLLYFMLHLAPRVSETRTLTGSIKRLNVGGRMAWVWHVVGKGGYEDRIPVPAHVMAELGAFRTALRIPALPLKDDPVPLLPSLKRLQKDGHILEIPQQMGRFAIYKRLTEVIFPAAAKLAEDRGMDGSLLLEASPHWLRHTALTELTNATGNIKLAQALGRHRSINTTSGYVQTDQSELLAALEDAHQQDKP